MKSRMTGKRISAILLAGVMLFQQTGALYAQESDDAVLPEEFLELLDDQEPELLPDEAAVFDEDQTEDPGSGQDEDVSSDDLILDDEEFIAEAEEIQAEETGAEYSAEPVTYTLLENTDSHPYPQSGHNYSNNMETVYSYTSEGADCLKVTFDARTKFEDDWDHLQIYRKAGTESGYQRIGIYTGTALAGVTLTVPGDTIRLLLESDEDTTYWGFAITEIYAGHCSGHVFGDGTTTIQPTCVKPGMLTRTCQLCGYKVDEEITPLSPTLSHSFGEPELIGAATCTTTGTNKYTCSVCGAIEYGTIPTLSEDGKHHYDYEHAYFNGGKYTASCTICGATVTATSGTCGDTLQWYKFAGDGVLMIVGSGAMTNYTQSSSLPWGTGIKKVIFDDAVTSIGSYAFYWCSSLTDVVLPTQLETIRNAAFAETGLKSIVLPDRAPGKTLTVGENAFWNSKIESADLGEGGLSLQMKSFGNCKSLNNITVPEDTTLGYDVFMYSALKSAVLQCPEVNEYTFEGCQSLESVTLENTVTIRRGAFRGALSLTELEFPATLEYLQGDLFNTYYTENGYRNVPISKVTFHNKDTQYDSDTFGNTIYLSDIYGYSCSTAYRLSKSSSNYTFHQIGESSHIWDDGEQTEASTCASEGSMSYTCTRCGDQKTEPIAKLPHTPEKNEGITPTCTQGGRLEYWECTECGGLFAEEACETELTQEQIVITALGHETGYVAAVAATCESAGSIEHWKCSRCEKLFADENCETELTQEQIVLPALGHDLEHITAVEATCEHPGNIEFWRCSRPGCGKCFSDADGNEEIRQSQTVIRQKDHVRVTDPAVAPTCTTSGLTSGVHCSECGRTLVPQRPIEATGHNYTSVVLQEATSTTKGYILYTCENCGDEYTEEIPEDIPVPDANCGSLRIISDSVSLGNTVYQGDFYIDYSGHVTASRSVTINGDVYVFGELLVIGSTLKINGTLYCLRYNNEMSAGSQYDYGRVVTIFGGGVNASEMKVTDEYLEAGIPEIIHERVVTRLGKDATCTEDGVSGEKYCTECGKTIQQAEVIPAYGHDMKHVDAKEAACDQAGNTDHWTCSRCGKLFTDENCENELVTEQVVIEALGHSPSKVNAVAASCEEAGNIEYWKCGRCNRLFAEEACETELTQDQTVTTALDHDWDEGTVTTEPTCSKTGVKTFTCKRDGTHTKTETISALGHKIEKVAAVPATCENAGSIEYWKCGRCDRLFAEEACETELTQDQTVTKATGHDWNEGSVTKKATCTEAGERLFVCRHDAEHVKKETLPVLGHDPMKVNAVPASCVKAGNIGYWKCRRCGKLFADANCTKAITSADTVIPAAGHRLQRTAAKTATCTAAGNIEYWYCGTCKKYFRDSAGKTEITQTATVIKAAGHKWNTGYTVDKPATTAAAGSKSIHCSVCGAVKPGSSMAIPKLAPQKVTLIAAYNGAHGVGVKWIKLAGATEYTIWQKYNGVWKPIATVKPNDSRLQVSGNTLMYTDQTVKTGYGKGYIYSVSAKIGNTVVDYDRAGVAIYRLNPPTLVKAVNSKTGTAVVSWKGVFGSTETNGAYDLQYATEANAKAGKFTSVMKLPGYAHNVTSATVTGLKKGTKYIFRIRCSKTNKDRGTFYSEYSPWLSVTISK